ncbi:hypothetical protein QR680_009187 [Steinernema hermaphroditum]|uniref:FHA domain-containing protein n=1 Tax=Steinernema hermaphroditum TaxID=289476 RepID=A0AA39ILR0_9BILA|nr:hypothetical protein QR680_009187 [Steinernema hermaphroditum]
MGDARVSDPIFERFPIPDWATRPPHGYHLDVLKGDQLIQKLMVDERNAYYFGRNPKLSDILTEHSSISRVHAVLIYHRHLKRFALVDMGSAHGTYVGKVKIESQIPVFLELNSEFHFGFSTRKYILKPKISSRLDSTDEDGGEGDATSLKDVDLENLTEYNTALNRRIPQIPITVEEARRKKKPRGNVSFVEDETVINPEDVDPTIGRFRNLISTAIITTTSKRPADTVDDNSLPSKKIYRPVKDDSIARGPQFGKLSTTTLTGFGMVNAAPDLDLYKGLPEPATSTHDDDEPHKKKYAKEAWPGRHTPASAQMMADLEETAVHPLDDDDNRFLKNHCVELFEQPDFVMEPQVKTSSVAFIQAGGKPEELIEILSSNYSALGQTCNLIGDWLADLEVDDAPKPKKGGRGRRSTKNAPSEADASGAFKNCANVYGSFESTISGLISRHFNSETVDKAFETDSEVGMEWLPQLITHKAWRKLVYELSEQNPQCLTLTFCVKLISEAGFQHEISSVNTAARQLDIFCGVLVASIDSLLTEHSRGPGTESYEKAFAELVKVACHSEHTYLYTQTILKVMIRKNDGMVRAACAHIANSLREALFRKEQDTSSIDLLLLQSPEDKIPQNAVQAIQTMISKRDLNPGDIVTLHQLYSRPNPPSVDLIRDPIFVNMLIHALFNCEGMKRLNDHRAKYIFLYAYASCVAESRSANGVRMQKKDELVSTCSQLDQITTLLESSDDLLKIFRKLQMLIKTPAPAAGLLHYLRTYFMNDALVSEIPPVVFVLIDLVASAHVNLHYRVFEVLCDLYENQSSKNEVAEVLMERQRSVIDRFVHLVSVGLVLPVAEKVTRMWVDGFMDISLVRYFALEVLEMIAPPYSEEFISVFLPLVENPDIFDPSQYSQKFQSAKEFVDICTTPSTAPSTSKRKSK